MNVHKMIRELRAEHAQIEQAIIALQKVGGKRRGRPPKRATDAPAHARTQRKKDQPPNDSAKA
jgi:hypothetical protein